MLLPFELQHIPAVTHCPSCFMLLQGGASFLQGVGSFSSKAQIYKAICEMQNNK